jgi:hypothetical protein
LVAQRTFALINLPENALRSLLMPVQTERTVIPRVADLYGQSLPDPTRWRGESLKTTHDHFAQ